jgi:tripartite ATP-independent transporter DctM subunit
LKWFNGNFYFYRSDYSKDDNRNNQNEAGDRLVQTFRGLFSWMPGGMIIATVVICAFFTSFTGASGVTILALGGILFSVLSEHAKYPEKFSIGLLTSSGSIGLLFPPSLPIILVGATTMTYIMHLFLGGIIPGVILVVAVIIFGIAASLTFKIPVEPFRFREALMGLRKSVFEIILPFLLIGGFFSGILSLVEIAAVLICAFFTSFTGASGVTILALGGILYSVLSEHAKYTEKFTIGLLTSSGSIGLLFPPSLPIILVGATTMTNIMHLFLGGIIPGLILVAALIVFGIVASVKTKIPLEPFRIREEIRGLKISVFEIILPFLLIAGFFSGILSLVEIAAVALIYMFIVEVFIHRDIKLSNLVPLCRKAVPIMGGVLSIIALSMALSYYIVDTQAPDRLAAWMQATVESKYVFLLLLNLALLVVGCLMDIFSAILIVLPLVAPLGQAYGIDPVHLGIIFITNLEVGCLTPPVGLNLFLATYRFKKPFTEICRYVFPFLLIQLVVVILVTYVPWFSTYLTRFF